MSLGMECETASEKSDGNLAWMETPTNMNTSAFEKTDA